MSEKNKIRNCPFCGGTMNAETDVVDVDFGNTGWFGIRVECDCGAAGRTFDAHGYYSPVEKAEEKAIDWWNKREG